MDRAEGALLVAEKALEEVKELKAIIDQMLAAPKGAISFVINDSGELVLVQEDGTLKALGHVRGETGERGLMGPEGREGLPGEPGRDALELPILPAIDETRSYPRSTYAKHANGLWRSYEKTDGMKGWECIVAGTSSVEVVQHDDDPRRVSFVVTLSDGSRAQKDVRFPIVIDRGVFKAGTSYEQGDGATWDGSFWIAQKDTSDKPGINDSWRLCTKKGRDGKDGAPGPRGEKGMDGRAGRDLTHMSPDGTKY